jgi:hypothetical protein
MESRKREKCAHKSCNCMAGNDSKYCSPYCEAAKDTTEIACGCEHASCAGKIS